jgi:two-component system chemotaxis sensor kinase CheA
LLDEIRNDKINLTDELIELFLLVNDHSKMLIDLVVESCELDEEQLQYHDDLISQLQGYLQAGSTQSEATKSQNTAQTTIQNQQEDTQQQNISSYAVAMKLNKDFLSSGMDIISIIKYLNVIADVENINLDISDIPSLDQIDISKTYFNVSFNCIGCENEQEIINAFEFVKDYIKLEITNNNNNNNNNNNDNTKEQSSIQEQSQQKSQSQSTNNQTNTTSLAKQKQKQTKATTKNNQTQPNKKSFTLRVDSSKIDKLINQISEMVISNAKVIQYALDSKDSDFEEVVMNISSMLEEIRDGIMNIRMVQVGDSFSKLKRIVNDTAKKLGKDINFQIIGGETELDKTVIEKISDPLVHMLRNSVDHGIELPHVREQAQKDPKGNIILKAYPDAGTIVIEIQDDGAGINKDLILQKAIEKGIVSSDVTLSDKAIYNLIFAPGFSTAQEVSDLSGRGVGLDVVKRNIEDLRGTVEIDSKEKVGTTMTIRLPLTLAIIDGFLVQVGKKKYIIPLDMISECIELTQRQKDKMQGNGYITLRKEILPILNVQQYFNEEFVPKVRENIVVVKYGNSQIGLQVDELYGEFQTVIKPLGELFENVAGISGCTILGSGEIALIFDIPKLIEYKIMQTQQLLK